jgi:hypothetical protein
MSFGFRCMHGFADSYVPADKLDKLAKWVR